jgi:hypothetical protein
MKETTQENLDLCKVRTIEYMKAITDCLSLETKKVEPKNDIECSIESSSVINALKGVLFCTVFSGPLEKEVKKEILKALFREVAIIVDVVDKT